MKWSITYFYNIKFMTSSQLPLSTAVWPPKFFSKNSKKNEAHLDDKGVILGLTIHQFVPQLQEECPCNSKDYLHCSFLEKYHEQLSKLDFDEVIATYESIADKLSDITSAKIHEIVLLVYEKPDNPCSERTVLKKVFAEHGMQLEEWRQ